MKISSKAHYGLQAAYILAESAGESYSASELGKKIGVSSKYLERIMRALCSAGAVKAARGAKGGYCLSDKPDNISVGVIVRALEDDLEIIGCVKSGSCGKCASSAVWKKLYLGINDLLDGISLADMLESESASHSINEKTENSAMDKKIERAPRDCFSCSECGGKCGAECSNKNNC